MWEDGRVEILPDDPPKHSFLLDFSKAKTNEDVITEFVRAFDMNPKNTKDFSEIWGRLLSSLLLRISLVEVRGLENLKKIDNAYETTIKILQGIKRNWDNTYSDRFMVTVIHENGDKELL